MDNHPKVVMMILPALDSALASLPLAASYSDDVTPRVACQPEELLAAFRLTYNSYLGAGLAWPNRDRLRVTPYQLESSSEVFIAVKEGEVIVTVSLVPDGRLGLPMEEVYPGEVGRMREAGYRMAEVSCLADCQSKVGRSLPVLLKLFSLLFYNARHQGIERLLIAVHPRHAAFYQRIIGFEQVGGVRRYGAVLNRPAVALSLDLNVPDDKSTSAYRECFSDPFPPERFVRALPRCRKFMERMRYFAAAQNRWEHETRWTDQPLPVQTTAASLSDRVAVPA